jgi:hypothetical protein
LPPYSTPDLEHGALNPRRKTLAALALAGMAVAAIIAVTYVADLGRNNNNTLPAGCVKPAGGFIVVASNLGYNDSISHGAPTKPWPIITVAKGSTVNIVVCNVDKEAHGFQITHYFESSIETVGPGQIIKVSFVADQSGSFTIYCSILCGIHVYMQNGQLLVNA